MSVSQPTEYAGMGMWHKCLSAYRVCRQGGHGMSVSQPTEYAGKGTWHECLSAYSVPVRGHGMSVSQPTVCRYGDMA